MAGRYNPWRIVRRGEKLKIIKLYDSPLDDFIFYLSF